MKYYLDLLKEGVASKNPVFVQVLALCPLLAVTTSAMNGLAMGLATTAAMISASSVISFIRKLIPGNIRIAVFVVVIAGLVTMIQLLLEAFAPDINDALGIFIPLIVVNCILFARVESFAFKNKVFNSGFDAMSMGLGFTVALFIVGAIREFFGAGSIFGFEVITDTTSHMLTMIMAPGAFFTLGVLIMISKYLQKRGGR